MCLLFSFFNFQSGTRNIDMNIEVSFHLQHKAAENAIEIE